MNIAVQAQSVGEVVTPYGSMNINATWAITVPVGSIVQNTLTQNNFTLVGPPFQTTPNMVVIIPPAGNTQHWQLKGVGADVGVDMGVTTPVAFMLGTAGASITIGLAAGVDKVFTFVWL